ncbi:serine/threonine-protein phosphatase [Streptomyces sp. JH14]|uniref:PP2C family protein-serine/threonine phosphatase n=1 Tax=Streptomyces sp. JH14 TaxID=2793630 RepID=UPI0023F762B1|nr:PP2C family protein-serine/threonine phosphatase [Streptomyces sp. JH14]MDF6040769.1 serine/threonine-protein phosphatase [Streptomyces sp. JH14]
MLGIRDRSSSLHVHGHSVAWIPPLVLLAMICLVDWNTVGDFRSVSWVVLVPAVAAAICGVRITAIYSLLALITYLLVDYARPLEYQVGLPGLILVALSGILATAACCVRVRADRRLRHMQDVVETTRRTVLRPLPSRWYGLDHAAVYLPADSAARVGGDFYDIQPSPYGPRIVLGDVQGKGLGAVAVASVLLGTFRESGYHEPDLATVAERLEIRIRRHRSHMARIQAARDRRGAYDGTHDNPYDSTFDPAYDSRYYQDHTLGAANAGYYAAQAEDDVAGADTWLDSERFATAVLVGFPPSAQDTDPHKSSNPRYGPPDFSRGIHVVNFGHDPPLVVGPCGVRELPPGDGLPVGMGDLTGVPPQLQHASLALDETLLLFTDGVTEARDADGTFFPLREHIAAALADDPGVAEPVRLVQLIRDATLRHTGGQLADDTTVFAVRYATTAGRAAQRPRPRRDL